MKTASNMFSGIFFATPIVILSLALPGVLPNFSGVHAAAVPIIWDTDMSTDVDDDGALAMIYKLQADGFCKLLCIGLPTNDKNSPGRTDAINTYFGYPNIPIGVNKALTLITRSSVSTHIATNFPNSIGVDGGNNCPNAL